MLKHLCDYNYEEEFDLVLLISNSQLRRNKKDKLFLTLQLSDSTQSIRGHYWNASENDALKFESGTLVEIDGKKEEYQGRTQIKIYHIRPVGFNEGYDLKEFIKQAPENEITMEQEINKYIEKIENETWQSVVKYLLHKWHDRFFEYPAGKSNHHAVKSGLAYHTVSMLRDARSIIKNYPQLNPSLLYAGCILHDMGKVLELSGSVSTQYTTEGNLIGHLVIIDEQIVLAANALRLDLEEEDLLLLRHMVLSHHGKGEYGSPKKPAILEAEILHRIDDMDAMLYAVTNALQHTEPGEFTEFIQSQDNRRFYRPLNDQYLDDFKKLE